MHLKFARQRCKTFNNLFLFICTCSFLFPYKNAVADIAKPDINTNAFNLSISHDECKAKATEVASFVFVEYSQQENNNIFRIGGRTSDSRALLVCMRKNQGVHFVVIAVSDGFQNEQRTIVERITRFMFE